MNYAVLASDGWSINNLLQRVGELVPQWGGMIVIISGGILMLAMVIWGVVKFLKKGQDQTSWVFLIVGLIIGGALAFGGWSVVENVGRGGLQTIEDLGTGGAIFWVR